MARRKTPVAPASPEQDVHATKSTEWEQLCEITIHRILRNGFTIEYLRGMTSVQIGGELNSGVVLVVSAGIKTVRNVRHTAPGVSEGLTDMAQDGLAGRMILYGLGFHFAPANP